MTELKFEVGKHYRTRDGGKSLCVYSWNSGTAVFVSGVPGEAWTVSDDGRHRIGYTTPHDIVSEWHEPRQWTVCIVEYSIEGDLCATLYPGNRKVLAAARVTEGEGLLETKETDQ